MDFAAHEKELSTPRTSFTNNSTSIFRRNCSDPDALLDPDSDCGGGGPHSKPPPPPSKPSSAAAAARYLECLRNHAASVGGNVLDGCREFMQSGEDGTPQALKCAACSCHRSFHRKSFPEGGGGGGEGRMLQLSPPPLPSSSSRGLLLHPQHRLPMGGFGGGGGLNGSPYGLSAAAQPMAVAFGGSAGAESSSEDANVLQSNAAAATPQHHHHLHHHHHQGAPLYPSASSKKRFRTKFTPEQKEKMMEFAERMGWRIQNRNEAEIQKFCAEVGVRRQVFKVWMHNNKNTVKQQKQEEQQQQQPEEHPQHHDQQQQQQQQQQF